MSELKTNVLYYGDNLDILRHHIPDESVDLIYLDPPFNSKRSYNVLFKEASGAGSQAQIEAFEDTWHWEGAAPAYEEMMTKGPANVRRILGALVDGLGHNDVTAYVTMMAIRLVELRNVLKPTGSIYLHCDPTASHYLKMLMDSIFGPKNFRNEVIWKRSQAHSSSKRYGPVHDSLLFYTRGEPYVWNPQAQGYSAEYMDSHYSNVDDDGRRYKRGDPTGSGIRHGETGQPWRGINPTLKNRHWIRRPADMDILDKEGRIYWPKKSGAWPYIKLYLDEMPGVVLQDTWTDIDPVNPVAKERLGYPTQKPLALLDRIIAASSNEGDVVLDPFCGTKPQQFEYWVINRLDAIPTGGKGPELDGVKPFIEFGNVIKAAIISVKGTTTVNPEMIREVLGVLDDQHPIGLLVTLVPSTEGMRTVAAAAGFYESAGKKYRKMQLICVEDMLKGVGPELPTPTTAFAQAAKEVIPKGTQPRLDVT